MSGSEFPPRLQVIHHLSDAKGKVPAEIEGQHDPKVAAQSLVVSLHAAKHAWAKGDMHVAAAHLDAAKIVGHHLLWLMGVESPAKEDGLEPEAKKP